jgi:tetratricopeptide (TPR) repeat protein
MPFTPTPPPARAEAAEELERHDLEWIDSIRGESAEQGVEQAVPDPPEHEAIEAPFADEGPSRAPARLPRYLGPLIAVVAALALITVAIARARRPLQPAPTSSETDIATSPAEGPRLPQLPALEPSSDPIVEDDAGFAIDAAGAKREALIALDAWRLADAIAAGERAVGFDKNDGEAWLILGAAYQVSGQIAQAKRCYETCVKQGRQDPRGECAAMLQGALVAPVMTTAGLRLNRAPRLATPPSASATAATPASPAAASASAPTPTSTPTPIATSTSSAPTPDEKTKAGEGIENGLKSP